MKFSTRQLASGTILKFGIGGAVALGAVATGLILSRRGRHLVRDAWRAKLRPPLEHRVLDAVWSDPVLGRRSIDLSEVEPGRIRLTGWVRSDEELERALRVVQQVDGVEAVDHELEIRAGSTGAG